MKYSVASFILIAGLFVSVPAEAQKRPLATEDIYNFKEVRDPQRSPDGKWVAYVVSRAIKDTDKNDTDIWMASWDGAQEIQLTSTPDGESRSTIDVLVGLLQTKQDVVPQRGAEETRYLRRIRTSGWDKKLVRFRNLLAVPTDLT